MLRRKRMRPAGRMSLSHARSSPVSSAAERPTTSRLPAAWRMLRVMAHLPPTSQKRDVGHPQVCMELGSWLGQLLLEFFEQIESLQRRERIDVGFSNAIDDALRERSEDGHLYRLGGFDLDAAPLLLFVLAQNVPCALQHHAGQPGEFCDF